MKTILIIIITSICACFTVDAQQMNTKKSFGEVQLYMNNEKIGLSDAIETAKNNEAALHEFKKAKTNRTIATILSVAGGACVGYPLGAAIGNGDAPWAVAGVGAGLIGVSIPFITATNRRINNGVKAYNTPVVQQNNSTPEFRMNMNSNGIGIAMQF